MQQLTIWREEMPYIKQTDRAELKPHVDYLLLELISRQFPPGEVNYSITKILTAWWAASPQTYSTLATMTGVLDTIKSEFKRRIVDPFEDRKREEHGDVY
jgi:hypothetical protein